MTFDGNMQEEVS